MPALCRGFTVRRRNGKADPKWLKPGDVVRLGIEGLGEQQAISSESFGQFTTLRGHSVE